MRPGGRPWQLGGRVEGLDLEPEALVQHTVRQVCHRQALLLPPQIIALTLPQAWAIHSLTTSADRTNMILQILNLAISCLGYGALTNILLCGPRRFLSL